ncbi:hypothetical protein PPNK14_13180 [Pectobacterium parmentieri]
MTIVNEKAYKLHFKIIEVAIVCTNREKAKRLADLAATHLAMTVCICFIIANKGELNYGGEPRARIPDACSGWI